MARPALLSFQAAALPAAAAVGIGVDQAPSPDGGKGPPGTRLLVADLCAD